MKVKALVITGYGVNCDEETNYALSLAGADTQVIHINDLINNKDLFQQTNIIAFPGGFSYADDTGSGKALANKIRNNVFSELKEFIGGGGLVIGICNGFQVLTCLGLLPALGKDYGHQEVALIHNDQARFECRWVNIQNYSSKCIFTTDLDKLEIPIAHGEGKFFTEPQTLAKLVANDQVVFRYVNEDGSAANGLYPANPNGALDDIAGICDETGRVLGLMPHPERAISACSHPGYQNLKEQCKRENKKIPKTYLPALKIFENAVKYVEKQLSN